MTYLQEKAMEEKTGTVKEKIQKMLKDHPVLLFMKGSPEQPMCGFSARVSQILSFIQVSFHSYNVLSDESIRHGIKEYAQWPTIPQLYVKGEFIGGCDIVQEQFENGELEKLLSEFKKELPQNP